MDRGCFCFCLDFRLTEKSNRPVVTLPLRSNQSQWNEIRGPKYLFIFDPEIEIFFATTPEFSKLGYFIKFMYRKRNKINILRNFRVSSSQQNTWNQTTYIFINGQSILLIVKSCKKSPRGMKIVPSRNWKLTLRRCESTFLIFTKLPKLQKTKYI